MTMSTVGISGELEGVKEHLEAATTFEQLSEIHTAIQRIVSVRPELEGTAELSRVREDLFQRIITVVPMITTSGEAQEALGMIALTVIAEPDIPQSEAGTAAISQLIKTGRDSQRERLRRALDRLKELGILAPEPQDAA
jgi:hypothetical protein